MRTLPLYLDQVGQFVGCRAGRERVPDSWGLPPFRRLLVWSSVNGWFYFRTARARIPTDQRRHLGALKRVNSFPYGTGKRGLNGAPCGFVEVSLDKVVCVSMEACRSKRVYVPAGD
eukprot:185677-Rhodomonas_salina.1